MTQQAPDVPGSLPPLQLEHVTVVPSGWSLVRIHDLGGRHPREHHEPRWFGPHPDKGRFDHHPPGPPRDHEPDRGVIYATCEDPTVLAGPLVSEVAEDGVPATALDVALAEFVQSDDEITLTDGLMLSVFSATEDLHLLDLRSTWGQMTRAGTHLSTAAHHRTQPWAVAIRAEYPELHGIMYVPATGGRAVAVALNESTVPTLADGPVLLSRQLKDDALLPAVTHTAARLEIVITYG